jgi:hypothetical protein
MGKREKSVLNLLKEMLSPISLGTLKEHTSSLKNVPRGYNAKYL